MAAMSSLDERLGAAMRLGLAEQRWDEAINEVRLTLVDHSASAKALLALAVCYFHKREFAEAIAWLDRAERQAKRTGGTVGGEAGEVVDDVPWPAIYLFRGLAYAARRLPSAARADFAELHAFDPSPIRWERFRQTLRPDELARARFAVEAAGLPRE